MLKDKIVLSLGAQFLDVLMAALALVVARWSGEELLLIAAISHGRDILPTTDLSRTIGGMAFTNRYLVHVDRDASLEEVIVSLREQRQQTHQAEGWLKIMRWDRFPEEITALKPNIFFNYTGQASYLGPTLFKVTPNLEKRYKDPTEQEFWVSFMFEASIVGGRLHSSWTYSDRMYYRETVEKLNQHYIQVLQSIAI